MVFADFVFVFWSRSAVRYEYMVVWCVTQTLNSTFQSLYFCPTLLRIMVWCVVQIVDYHVFFIVIFLSGPHTVQFYNMMAQSTAHTVISHFQSQFYFPDLLKSVKWFGVWHR